MKQIISKKQMNKTQIIKYGIIGLIVVGAINVIGWLFSAMSLVIPVAIIGGGGYFIYNYLNKK